MSLSYAWSLEPARYINWFSLRWEGLRLSVEPEWVAVELQLRRPWREARGCGGPIIRGEGT